MLNELALRALVAIKGLSGKFQDEEGQTLAEYGLILAVIAVFVIGGAAVVLRTQIESAFNNAAGCLDGSC